MKSFGLPVLAAIAVVALVAAAFTIDSKKRSLDTKSNTQILSKNIDVAAAKEGGALANENFAGRDSDPLTAQIKNTLKPGQRSDLSVDNPTGRQAYYDYIIQQPPLHIYSIWNGAAQKNNPDETSQIIAALGYSLRTNPDVLVYKKIGDDLLNKNNSVSMRLASADALMFAGSRESIEQLMRFVRSTDAWSNGTSIILAPDQEVVDHAMRMIEAVARTSIDGGRNWPVSSVLLSAWNSIGDGAATRLVDTVANGIVYLGKPTDVDELLRSIGRLNVVGYKYQSALRAIEKIQANESVEILASALTYYQGDISKSIALGLISIGTADSIAAVIKYLDSGVIVNTPWVNEIKKMLLERRSSPEVQKVLTSWRNK